MYKKYKVLICLMAVVSLFLQGSCGDQSEEDENLQQGLSTDSKRCFRVRKQKLLCKKYIIPVTLAPDSTEVYNVVGTLCWRGSLNKKTVQLLISGGSYGPVYWDFPLYPKLYSYVRAATLSGYATFNLSRIGIGDSDHPPGADVDLESNVYVVHQVIQSLRSGSIGGVAFKRVMSVGHSLGSLISIKIGSEYPDDLDGIVLTGFLHYLNLDVVEQVMATAWYPAMLDPLFADMGLDDQYITTVPGVRASIFYNDLTSDPDVTEMDEATKETVTLGEMSVLDLFSSTISREIDVPVMLVVGVTDYSFCGGEVDCTDCQAVLEHESTFFSPEARLRVVMVPETGHNLNLHITAPFTYRAILKWSNRMVGRRTGRRHP